MNSLGQNRDQQEADDSVSTPPNTVKFQLTSDPKLLKVVRLIVAHLCDLVGFPEAQRHRATLAVDEACANIIRHAYEGATDKPVIITARLLDNGIEVVLRDFGKKADVEKIKSRELDDIRPGGLGVHLMQSAMDEVVFDDTLPEGNQLTLVKYLPPLRSDTHEEVVP